MSEKDYIIYLPLNMRVKKLYVNIAPNEYDWDFTSNIKWAGLFSKNRADEFKNIALKELGLELEIEEVSEEDI